MGQCVFTGFYMLLNQAFHLEKFYGSRLSSHMWIYVYKQTYSERNESFGKVSQFWYNISSPCKMITAVGFAKVLIPNFAERQSIRSNEYSYNYQWL
jgi:hypothetical protein